MGPRTAEQDNPYRAPVTEMTLKGGAGPLTRPGWLSPKRRTPVRASARLVAVRCRTDWAGAAYACAKQAAAAAIPLQGAA
ncbi:hypothetical protein GCM10018980_70640 [Streptomyces capoamus]|uniref:Uncharacterized protein n=1 Tax=Streptomyces capoamus TaxID=68183 RepID=A0A919KFV4_9ACTN|nr:hypothetical protein GCM10010501_17480 [Streptomyces libani subsp. rufus]GHG74011.1 hypothetical protein GCM10018980_70640 [Streptomyces capoamus]